MAGAFSSAFSTAFDIHVVSGHGGWTLAPQQRQTREVLSWRRKMIFNEDLLKKLKGMK